MSKKTTKYPMKLLKPIGNFLSSQLRSLEKTKKQISESDPYKNKSRVAENKASPDDDADEVFDHARASAISDQLDRKIIQTRRALSMIKIGSYGLCEKCGQMINTDRLMIKPEATLCIKCEEKAEKSS